MSWLRDIRNQKPGIPKGQSRRRRLLCVTVLLLIILASCTATGEYEIETFDLGKGRSIEILASEDAEVSQSFYYQVKVDQKIVTTLCMICVGHDRGQLKFKTLIAKDGDLVGIFEQKHPQEILAIHDFKSHDSWPRQEGFGAALLKDLQAEHKDIQLKLGQERACE